MGLRIGSLGVAFCLLLAGCATLSRQEAVPVAMEERATVLGTPGLRYWAGRDLADFVADAKAAYERELATWRAAGNQGPLPPANFLAVSGGGEDGAFGAGLLCGWTAAGTRPTFKAVTGISTGALTAPFAFLGPAYDDKLRAVYTETSAADVLRQRSYLAAVLQDAAADTSPLRRTIAKYFDQKMLDAIAAEHAKGRLLLIGTTNLDARRPIIWNVTKIAASGRPGALALVQNILVASAAIPGAFPPVLIDAEVDGKPYQEMHVDGGASAQVFLYPPSLNLRAQDQAVGIARERRAYIIRNSRLDPDWSQVERRTLSIAGRAISSLIQTQGVGDLYRIYVTAQRDGVDYNLAYIPETFTTLLKEPFDTAYMRELFRVGYDLAAKGYPWAKAPPGWTAPEIEPPLPTPRQERGSGGPERAPSAAVTTAFP
jgi:predicted acylesterase/phospholipase RssA